MRGSPKTKRVKTNHSHVDSRVFRDIVTLIAPHLDIATFVALKRTCKGFHKALTPLVPTPLKWYRKQMERLERYMQLHWIKPHVIPSEPLLHTRCARCGGLDWGPRYGHEIEPNRLCCRGTSECESCLDNLPCIICSFAVVTPDEKIEALRKNFEVYGIRTCYVCDSLTPDAFEDSYRSECARCGSPLCENCWYNPKGLIYRSTGSDSYKELVCTSCAAKDPM